MKEYSYLIAIATTLAGVIPPVVNSYAADSSTIENVIPDTTITSAIKAKYIADEKIKAFDINVKTVNSVVTLTGTVTSSDINDRAVSIAENTNGVKQVISNLTLSTAYSSKIKNMIPDAAITSAVKAKYITDEKIKAFDINVKTVNGVVTLTGTVPSSDINDRAVSIAENTNGVKQVVSNLTIKN